MSVNAFKAESMSVKSNPLAWALRASKNCLRRRQDLTGPRERTRGSEAAGARLRSFASKAQSVWGGGGGGGRPHFPCSLALSVLHFAGGASFLRSGTCRPLTSSEESKCLLRKLKWKHIGQAGPHKCQKMPTASKPLSLQASKPLSL